MSIPKQVQAQLDEADRIEAELLAAQQPPAEEQEDPAPEPQPEGVQPATEPVPPEASIPAAPEVSEETWERRFKTLKGKYDAEVPRLNAELKDLRRSVDQLTQAAKAKPAAEPEQPLVSDKDVENFGSDLIDVIDRKAREVARQLVGTEMAELKAENTTLREQLDGVTERQTTNDRRTYFTELERLVPDWEVVNADDGFLAWLGEVDALSGAPRQAYLDTAFNGQDVARTAALFNTYKQSVAPAPEAKAKPPKDLQRQVAPGTSKANSSAPSNDSANKIWAMQEIEQFYAAASKGHFRDNPAEAQRIEQEIDLAVATGRVR